MWILDYIQENSIKYSIIFSLLISLLNFCVNYFFFERKKLEIAKEIDVHKHQLQVSLLKAELKIKQLSTIYPELFAKFKYTEKALGYLFGDLFLEKINPDLSDWDKRGKEAVSAKSELENFLMINLLFLSSEVKQCALEIVAKMDNFFVLCCKCKNANDSDLKDKKLLTEIESELQKLEKYMQDDLSGEK